MDRRWTLLALMFVARIGLGFQFQTLGSVSSNLVSDLGLNYTQIGTLIGLFMLPGIFLSIPAGLAGQFMSDRFIVGLGFVTLGAGGVLASLAQSFEMLAVARVVCGAGFVFANIFMAKIVADMFAGKELATAMGAFVMSWPGGIAVGQIGHGWVAASYDWQTAFLVASAYSIAGAFLVLFFCRNIPGATTQTGGLRFSLNRNEVILTVVAGLVWSLFNAGYVVYLSFAPEVLVAGGYDTVSALGIISLASWLMIFSGIACGLVADRSGKADLVLYVCMAAAIAALMMLFVPRLAIPSSLLFGLLGIAPAGVIMALTVQATRPENRALGMGLFFTIYFVVQLSAPIVAGWLYDLTADQLWPMLFAALLFLLTAVANWGFRLAQKRLPI